MQKVNIIRCIIERKSEKLIDGKKNNKKLQKFRTVKFEFLKFE